MTYLKGYGVCSNLPCERIDSDFRGYCPQTLWQGAPLSAEFRKE